MKILRKKTTFDNPWSYNKVKVELETFDYGISFADLLSECDIEGHVTERFSSDIYATPYSSNREYLERCTICKMERDVTDYVGISVVGNDGLRKFITPPSKYSEWRHGKCYECEEECIISKPLNPICPNCKSTKDDGIYHTNSDKIVLFNCFECNTNDQIIE